MTDTKEKIPPCPAPVWAEIIRICRRGNDAIVKVHNGKMDVVESERKVRVRVSLTEDK